MMLPLIRSICLLAKFSKPDVGRRWPLFCLAAILPLCVSSPARAQVEVEAYVGQPFGVGRMTIAADQADESVDGPIDGPVAPLLREADERALYPALEQRPVREKIRNLLGVERSRRRRPEETTIYFLFRGDDALDLTWWTPNPHEAQVTPQREPRGHERLLNAWWRHFTRTASMSAREAEYPPLVENYLTATLARRLELRLPPREGWRSLVNPWGREAGILLGSEDARHDLQRERLLGDARFSRPADLALPPGPATRELSYPDLPTDVPVEPLAGHVPADAFYVRFGNFSNYLWTRDFLARWGGDVRNMIQRRGIDYQLDERVERQLGLSQTTLAKFLGPAVISDVALVGDDFFVREGASVGILFEARNNLLLSNDLRSQRKSAATSQANSTEKTVRIEGHDVSFVSTPDNQMRSFYAIDGDYHFVATSESLVRRFFEAGQGRRSLASTDEFRFARSRFPLRRDDTLFVYCSDPFWQKFASPRYRVEMTRRLVAAGDLNSALLARLAFHAEGRGEPRVVPGIEDLVKADLLPRSFETRTDGGAVRASADADGDWIDSLRGAPGCFIPIADMPVTGISSAEADEYERFVRDDLPRWREIGPLMIALRRGKSAGPGDERLEIEALATPIDAERLTPWAHWLGRPTTQTVAPIPGDIASLDLVLDKTLALNSQPVPDYHLLAGLRDYRSKWSVRGGRVVADGRPIELVRGYVGAWPFSGLLPMLFGIPDNPPVDGSDAIAEIPTGGAFFRRFRHFTIVSLKPDVLEEVTPHLDMVEAPRPAQARLNIADLTGREFAETLNALGFMRARETSLSVAHLMNILSAQLHVPPERADRLAQSLVQGKFACALGGKYQLVEQRNGQKFWTTSALADENRRSLTRVPEGYELPLLSWFRGLNAELAAGAGEISLRATIELAN